MSDYNVTPAVDRLNKTLKEILKCLKKLTSSTHHSPEDHHHARGRSDPDSVATKETRWQERREFDERMLNGKGLTASEIERLITDADVAERSVAIIEGLQEALKSQFGISFVDVTTDDDDGEIRIELIPAKDGLHTVPMKREDREFMLDLAAAVDLLLVARSCGGKTELDLSKFQNKLDRYKQYMEAQQGIVLDQTERLDSIGE